MVGIVGSDHFPSSPDGKLTLAFAQRHDGGGAIPEAGRGLLVVCGKLATAITAEEEEDGDEDEEDESAEYTAENGTECGGRDAMRGGGKSSGGGG